jgi:hypothetical protein
MCQLLAGATNQKTGDSFASTDVPTEEARELFREVDLDNPLPFRVTLNSKRFVRSATTENFQQFLLQFSVPIERCETRCFTDSIQYVWPPSFVLDTRSHLILALRLFQNFHQYFALDC